MQSFKPSGGAAYPLGSSYDGKGVNFALFSAHAEKVELCLFDRSRVGRVGTLRHHGKRQQHLAYLSGRG